MNFYKRKIFFLPLFLILIVLAVYLSDPDKIISEDNKAYSMQTVSGDTTETVQDTAEEYGGKKKKIRLDDQGSPKTVNLILYLIYRFTFKNVN